MTFQPNDFPNDPYGAVTSQAGHAAIIGMPLCAGVLWVWLAISGMGGLAFVAAPVVVALGYGLLWEGVVQRFTMPGDALMDTASVMAGQRYSPLRPRLIWSPPRSAWRHGLW